MKFIHFKNKTPIDLEKLVTILLVNDRIRFYEDLVNTEKYAYWIFETKKEAKEVYNQILKEFSTEIKIEE